jgi:hypothetical protein
MSAEAQNCLLVVAGKLLRKQRALLSNGSVLITWNPNRHKFIRTEYFYMVHVWVIYNENEMAS